MRILLALLLLTCVLAGCSDGGDEGTGSSTSSGPSASFSGSRSTSPSATPSVSGSGSPSPSPSGGNQPPTAQLSASVAEGTFNVTFAIDGADPDGDGLAWRLDADGDGTVEAEGDALPAEAVHAYASAGNFTATLTVSDGEAEAEASVTVALVAGGGASQSVDTEWAAGNAGCGGPYDTWVFGTPAAGVTHAEFDVDPLTVGLAYVATVGSASPVNVLGMDFYDADGARLDGTVAAGSTMGVVPEGAVFGLITDCGTAGPVTASYHAGADVPMPE